MAEGSGLQPQAFGRVLLEVGRFHERVRAGGVRAELHIHVSALKLV